MIKKNGFTFLELLTALTLLALLLTPVLYLLQSSTRGIAMNRDEISAHSAAYELLEQLLSIPYEDLPVGTFDPALISELQTTGSGTAWPFHISNSGPFSRSLEISEFSSDNRARYKKITVTLSLPASIASGTGRTFSRTVLYAKETL